MNALQYLKAHGREKSEEVAIKAGTTFAYFQQIAYGHRRPSVELADELVSASDGVMTFEALIRCKLRVA